MAPVPHKLPIDTGKARNLKVELLNGRRLV
jgi:hypothetical protein